MPVFKTATNWEDTACSPIGYKKLSLPFFLMGSPGVANARTSIAWLQRPKAINQAFLLRVADKLAKEPCRDWDWEGFQKNLILPNFDHIQIHHQITNPKVMSRWVEDLYVFHHDIRLTFYGERSIHFTSDETGTFFAGPLIEGCGKEIFVFGHGIGIRGRTDVALNVKDDISLNTAYVLYRVLVHGSEEKDVSSGAVIYG